MDSTQVGIALAVVGCGLNLAVVLPMKPATRKIVGGTGIVLVVLGLGMLGYSLMLRKSEVGDAGTSSSITQDHPINSPAIMGDGNQFTYNQGGGNASAVLGYARVDKHGVISTMENFREYGMRVKRNDFEERSVHSVGQTEYVLTFDKVPEPLDVRTQDGSSPKVDPILDRPNERRVRCMGAGFGGEFARECGFTVWALK